jgi:hypothetical protein
MSDYRVADGHDVVLGSLNVITPQPKSEGIQPVRRAYPISGHPYEEGYYIELTWDLLGSVTLFQSILSQFGLSAATTLSNEVTVYIPSGTYDYARFNGRAIRPEIGQNVLRRGYFLRNITILVRELEAAA